MNACIPFRYATHFIDERCKQESGLPLLSVSQYQGVVPRGDLTDRQSRAEDLSRYKVCGTGDIVLNRMSAYQGALGIAPMRGVVSPDYTVIRPAKQADGRYLTYLMKSTWFVGEMTRRIRGIGSVESGQVRTPRINNGDLGDIRIPLPPLDVQRRIADFLDDQVTRIDQAIGLRQRQVELLLSEEKSLLDKVVAASDEERLLAQLTDSQRRIQYGIVLPGPDFPGGVPIVKGGDVAAGRMSPEELNRTDPAIESGYPRSRLIAGDIVIAIRGSVGEVAVVPETLEGANITQDAARIAPHGCDPTWLRWVLATPTVQSRIRREITGATVTGINIGALRRIRIPFVPLDEQIQRGRAATELAGRSQRLRALATRSKHLLLERKRSLITAAVTGEFDVTTASFRASDGVMDGVGG